MPTLLYFVSFDSNHCLFSFLRPLFLSSLVCTFCFTRLDGTTFRFLNDFPLDTFSQHISFPLIPFFVSTIASFIPCHRHHHLHIIHAPIIIIIASNPPTVSPGLFILPFKSCPPDRLPACLGRCRCDRQLQGRCRSSVRASSLKQPARQGRPTWDRPPLPTSRLRSSIRATPPSLSSISSAPCSVVYPSYPPPTLTAGNEQLDQPKNNTRATLSFSVHTYVT